MGKVVASKIVADISEKVGKYLNFISDLFAKSLYLKLYNEHEIP